MKKPFEIGLALAGAVSGGAYTAGVVSFLLQALAEWERAKRTGGPDVPRHDVRLRAMSGTSSGGICAALTVLELAAGKPRLWEAWRRIALLDLLGTSDLARDPVLHSLLDGEALERITRELTPEGVVDSFPPYISEQLDVILTSTNLRGVRYAIEFIGAGPYVMRTHADRSQRSFTAPPAPGVLQDLLRVALATSAFPVGLPARLLPRNRTEYDERTWDVPETDPQNPDYVKLVAKPVTPVWPDGVPPAPPAPTFPSLNVDGGLLDNEPFELVRQVLTPVGHAERAGDRAPCAVIMVNPFASVPIDEPDLAEDAPLVRAALATARVLLEQPRFKNDEIALAQDPDVYTRYLVAPKRPRKGAPADDAPYPLATGSFGHFGGFLDESLRLHDFELGRRNCQQFLRETFTVPSANPIVATQPRGPTSPANGEIPLIPLYGSAAPDVRLLPWPYPIANFNLQAVLDAARRRGKAVAPELARQLLGHPHLGGTAWFFAGHFAVEALGGYVNAQLDDWAKRG